MVDLVRLTQTVKKGGCAAKIPALELKKIISRLRFPPKLSEVLVDGGTFDDAAIYAVDEKLALVQTLDFFTPIVDSPRLFGRVAAANAISDVYAMGGKPKTCLAILAFPLANFPNEVIQDVLQGACDIIEEANANLVGGHSIDDETLKFGLSVTGFVGRDQIWTNAGAKVGDLLILTKALGTGTLCAALKRSAYTEDQISEALLSMGQLNRIPDLLSSEMRSSIHAATDITGFGLSGHACQMAAESHVSFEFSKANLPFLERAEESLLQEFLTKAHATNREYTKDRISAEALSPAESLLIHDPQTSGGLLLSVSPLMADKILEEIRAQFPRATVLGRVVSRKEKDVYFG
jgi:selenide,water dikinase